MSKCPICNSQFKFRSNKIFCKRGCKEKARVRPYLLIHNKGACCSKCGFIAEHRCQLDVDHIDGNNSNNDVMNLQTLCANCHRLKTHKSGENSNIIYRSNQT